MIIASAQHYHASYDATFVLLSLFLAALGSFAALVSAARIHSEDHPVSVRWIVIAAIALGGGAIWSMHFIGMVAFHIDSDVRYDAPLTLASLAISVAVTGIGLALVSRDPTSPIRLLGGGVFAGLGIAAMHYTGMAAMSTSGHVEYNAGLVFASIVIAVVAAIAAYWIAFRIRTRLHLAAAALVMAAAVCGMHYTAMAATRVVIRPDVVPGGVDPLSLGLIVVIVAFAVQTVVIFFALGGVTDPGPLFEAQPGGYRFTVRREAGGPGVAGGTPALTSGNGAAGTAATAEEAGRGRGRGGRRRSSAAA